MGIGNIWRTTKGKMPWLLRSRRSRVPVTYPPVSAGIPALPVDQVLQPHAETMAKIRHLVEREEDWGRWYLPLIERYAAFVHLLPASEYHHHRGAGGLLSHGLEVGLYCIQRAHDKLYGMHLEPRLRRLARPRWQYGCFVAGLCHDVAKPVVLLRAVLEPSGRDLPDWDDRCWRPLAQDLVTWCREKGAERYWVVFRRKRQAKDHERLAGLALDRVLTAADRAYLSEYDSELLLNVMGTVQKEAGMDHEMSKLVLSADRRSVQEDLGRSNLARDIGQEVGLPVMRIISDAMLRLVREDVWRVNVAGGRLWYLESGLYLVWPEGGKDIGLLLDRDEAYRGVPRNPQTLAQIMLEWQFIEATSEGSPFWWVTLEGVTEKLLALKIREPRGLLEVMPAPWPGEVWGYESGREGELVEKEAEHEEEQLLAAEADLEKQSGDSEGIVAAEVLEEPDEPGPAQANQGDRPSALSRAGAALRGCLGRTGRAIWECVPAVVRKKLHGRQSEIEGETAATLALCQEMTAAVSALRSSVAAHGEQLSMLVETSRMLIKAIDMHYGGSEPMWVREITWLLCDGLPVSEFEAERIKRLFGGGGRVRDWFRLSEDGYVLGRVDWASEE